MKWVLPGVLHTASFSWIRDKSSKPMTRKDFLPRRIFQSTEQFLSKILSH